MAKKKKGPEGPASSWLDTYADTMTLLMTFFILLYSMSSLDAQKFKGLEEALKNSLGHIIITDDMDLTEVKIDIASDNTVSVAPSDTEEPEESGKNKYEELYEKLQQLIIKNSLTETVKLRQEEDGIALQLDESILFDSGKAVLKTNATKLLDTIYIIISQVDNDIIAEGHTDNVPISNGLYASNWELSTARATNIVKYFIEKKKVDPRRISLRGYGEYNPIAPNDTAENRAKNRRVDILVVEKKEN